MLKNRFMSVMPLGPTMHAKWDPASLGPPQMHPYKVDRPAYSTPPPVENTPANNECRMVELRGSQIASFSLGHEEYICLPQAFDLFLKHLVGGLHTVYTKLKRLSIAPVVCNVEQVRILRGLGAIQPGVNRCKLITRKDFEILYQDCTTASRPGRPPKRYPMLPPTADLMSHHTNMRSNNASLLNSSELSSLLPKRLRLDHNLDPQHIDQNASGSPTKENEKMCANPNEFHSNQSTNLAYLQAIRQYQQASMSGLHNGMESSQINSALAPYLMMSHPSLFAGIPPTSMAMFNHINQIAQSHTGGISNAAVAAAQLAAGGSPINQQSMHRENSHFGMGDKDSDNDEVDQPRSTMVRNSVGSDERTSPASSLGSIQDGGSSSFGDNRNRNNSFEYQAKNSPNGMKIGSNEMTDAVRELSKIGEYAQGASASEEDDKTQNAMGGNMSSLQTLLTNIQGLLKVVADNVSLQEKHSSIEIADLKIKLNKEKQLRESTQRKMEECEKGKADAEKFLQKEKKENLKLQTKVVSMQQLINQGDIALSSPLRSPQSSPAENGTPEVQLQSANPPTPPGSISSPTNSYVVTSTYEPSVFTARIAAAVQQVTGQRTSPPVSPESHSSTHQISNENNSNNHSEQSSEYVRRSMLRDGRAPDIAIDLALSRQQEATLQDAHHYFKNSLLYQPAASQ